MAKIVRLTRPQDFQRVYGEGRSYVNRLAVLHFLKTGEDTRIGFAASRKLGKAVVRNRIKRRIREAIRGISVPQGYDIVVAARSRAVEAKFGDLKRELEELMRRIERDDSE